MHAQVVTIQIRPAKLAGAIRIYRESVLPVLERQPGFGGARFLTDAVSGKGLMLSLWDSEADLTAIEASGLFQEQLAKFQPVLGAPASREDYEVSVAV